MIVESTCSIFSPMALLARFFCQKFLLCRMFFWGEIAHPLPLQKKKNNNNNNGPCLNGQKCYLFEIEA